MARTGPVAESRFRGPNRGKLPLVQIPGHGHLTCSKTVISNRSRTKVPVHLSQFRPLKKESELLAKGFRQRIMGANRGWIKVLRSNILRACVAALSIPLVIAPACAQETFGDPAGSGVLVSAVQWLQGTLLGTVATVVAVIAVAAVGFMMLTGRINWRYGATVILGCFILFGAASIVAGIQSTATLGN